MENNRRKKRRKKKSNKAVLIFLAVLVVIAAVVVVAQGGDDLVVDGGALLGGVVGEVEVALVLGHGHGHVGGVLDGDGDSGGRRGGIAIDIKGDSGRADAVACHRVGVVGVDIGNSVVAAGNRHSGCGRGGNTVGVNKIIGDSLALPHTNLQSAGGNPYTGGGVGVLIAADSAFTGSIICVIFRDRVLL